MICASGGTVGGFVSGEDIPLWWEQKGPSSHCCVASPILFFFFFSYRKKEIRIKKSYNASCMRVTEGWASSGDQFLFRYLLKIVFKMFPCWVCKAQPESVALLHLCISTYNQTTQAHL